MKWMRWMRPAIEGNKSLEARPSGEGYSFQLPRATRRDDLMRLSWGFAGMSSAWGCQWVTRVEAVKVPYAGQGCTASATVQKLIGPPS